MSMKNFYFLLLINIEDIADLYMLIPFNSFNFNIQKNPDTHIEYLDLNILSIL